MRGKKEESASELSPDTGVSTELQVEPTPIVEVAPEADVKPQEIEVSSCDTSDEYVQEKELYSELLLQYDGGHESALFEFCFKTNLPYCNDIIKKLFRGHRDEVFNQMPVIYIKTIKADFRYQGLTFFGQLKKENFEVLYSEELSLLSLTEEDKKNRLAVIDILSYDPFRDDDPQDRPQLYRDMSSMLTESMRKDVAKAKAALTIVRGYSNIEKYQKKINDILRSGNIDEDTQKQLDQMIKVQKTLQDSINATAEKNNFTVKGIGTAGKGMLSDVLNQIGERGIDEGVTNFYDIATSRSIEEVATISIRAQLNQVSLSKTDYADILTGQCVIVRDCQRKARDAIEALRLAREKITKQELLEELEQDYRRKGISEAEIEEFIRREYHLYDGTV